MSIATKKLSRLLRTHEDVVLDFEATMIRLTSKSDALDTLAEENNQRVGEALLTLGQELEASAEDVHAALTGKITENDRALNAYLDNPVCTTSEGCETLIELAKDIAGTPKGYFLKHEVAERLFSRNPPRSLMEELSVTSLGELFKEYPLDVLFPAVRFAEDPNWLNEVFFRPYDMLTPDDFEEREVKVIVLPEQFREIGTKFSGRKLHHISHLKELGVIFVMPFSGEQAKPPPGMTLELFTLVLHYLFEVPFYSRIFRRFAKDPETFVAHLLSALRGNVPNEVPEGGEGKRFLIVQRYLSKANPSDPRLFQPHVNPEATHWKLVEEKLAAFGKKHPKLGLDFWEGQDFVGEYFPLNASKEIYLARGVSEATVVSFDLVDNLISHNRNSMVLEKYLYHQQEALWNRMFYAFLGRERVEKMVEDNLEKGYIEVTKN